MFGTARQRAWPSRSARGHAATSRPAAGGCAARPPPSCCAVAAWGPARGVQSRREQHDTEGLSVNGSGAGGWAKAAELRGPRVFGFPIWLWPPGNAALGRRVLFAPAPRRSATAPRLWRCGGAHRREPAGRGAFGTVCSAVGSAPGWPELLRRPRGPWRLREPRCHGHSAGRVQAGVSGTCNLASAILCRFTCILHAFCIRVRKMHKNARFRYLATPGREALSAVLSQGQDGHRRPGRA